MFPLETDLAKSDSLIAVMSWCYHYCCGATVGSEQQHNQDLREIYKGRRILEFITFYHNALYLTRVHCATFNQSSLRHCATNRISSCLYLSCGWERAGKFSTARLEILSNLRHAGVFQMSTIVILGIGFQKPLTRPGVKLDEKMSICSSTP